MTIHQFNVFCCLECPAISRLNAAFFAHSFCFACPHWTLYDMSLKTCSFLFFSWNITSKLTDIFISSRLTIGRCFSTWSSTNLGPYNPTFMYSRKTSDSFKMLYLYMRTAFQHQCIFRVIISYMWNLRHNNTGMLPNKNNTDTLHFVHKVL